MAGIHQNLAVAVGAAKDQARGLLEQFERRGDALTGRSSAVYLALVVMQERLLAPDHARSRTLSLTSSTSVVPAARRWRRCNQ
jgi:hypothetical protein